MVPDRRALDRALLVLGDELLAKPADDPKSRFSQSTNEGHGPPLFIGYCGISGLSNEKVSKATLVHVLVCRSPKVAPRE